MTKYQKLNQIALRFISHYTKTHSGKPSIVFALFLVLTLLAFQSGKTPQVTNPLSSYLALTVEPTITPIIQSSNIAKITRVIDGDTIEIASGERVRLIGVDTPELSSTSTACFGKEAKAYTSSKLTGQTVRLEKDVSETDRYNRLLRYVWLGDELVNETLVRKGFASVATFPPDVKYQERFLEAQTDARNHSRGLWSACQTN